MNSDCPFNKNEICTADWSTQFAFREPGAPGPLKGWGAVCSGQRSVEHRATSTCLARSEQRGPSLATSVSQVRQVPCFC